MAASLKEHLDSISAAPMIDHYQAVGITPSVLAETGKKLLNAKTVKHLKLKGWIDKRKKLPEGYKIIKGTVDENVIECVLANDGVRVKTWIEICRQMGLYPTETVNVKHGFDEIIRSVIKDIHATAKGLPPLPSEEVEE